MNKRERERGRGLQSRDCGFWFCQRSGGDRMRHFVSERFWSYLLIQWRWNCVLWNWVVESVVKIWAVYLEGNEERVGSCRERRKRIGILEREYGDCRPWELRVEDEPAIAESQSRSLFDSWCLLLEYTTSYQISHDNCESATRLRQVVYWSWSRRRRLGCHTITW